MFFILTVHDGAAEDIVHILYEKIRRISSAGTARPGVTSFFKHLHNEHEPVFHVLGVARAGIAKIFTVSKSLNGT